MDFITKINGNISNKSIENLGSFLGENSSSVGSAMRLSVNSFMAGLLKFTNSDSEAIKILNILEDGGHTGDIFKNLESFTGNFEKTQLLVTIGNNIASHFLGNKTNILIDKISDISAVKKTSTSSLLSIAGPLVLGFIGKEVKESNLDAAGLRKYFKDISELVINALPPAVNNIFQFKLITPEKVSAKKDIIKSKNPNSKNWGTILPWIILLIAAVGAAIYHYKNKNSSLDLFNYENNKSVIDSEDTKPSDFLPDNSEEIQKDMNNTLGAQESEINKPNSNKNETALNPIVKTAPKPQPISPKSIKTTPIPVITETFKSSSPIKNKSIDAETITPSGWSVISSNIYKKNSAEITQPNGLSFLVKQLENRSKTIKIAPLSSGNVNLNEDRAYALREKLIEKGVKESQIEVVGSQKGSNNIGIITRIVN